MGEGSMDNWVHECMDKDGCMNGWVKEEVDWVEYKDGQVSDGMNGYIDGSCLNGRLMSELVGR